jgi:glutathione S-transferase
VPVLETTNGTLYESAAIALHVADLHGRFIPPVGTQERGLVYQWLFFAMTELEPHCVTFFAEKVHRKTPDSELAQKAKQKLGEAVKVLNAAVEGREFLVGDTFTVADVIVTAVAWWANRMGAVEQAPALVSYVERMTARPAWKRATQD